jgi:16S rRNA (adenine1518-N6/adenine1519-N6)-dimethyltransferase
LATARKRFAQHFLSDEWARKVVDAIAPAADDLFLEIGPGRGALTRPLAARAARVIAVEIDRDLAGELQRTVPPNVSVITADFLDLDLQDIAREHAGNHGLRIAGNLPYNISSPIIFRLIDAHRRTGLVRDATVMLQRELVERLSAQRGTKEYGVLTILARLHADIRTLLALPPRAFRPVPRVWSAVARLSFTAPKVAVSDPAWFERLVKTLFSHRRKTVLNALKPLVSGGPEARRVLEQARIDPSRRPETLDLPELALLTEVLGSSGSRAVL